jgi:uncharacterized membrane protein HdeD (DUF308 family)
MQPEREFRSVILAKNWWSLVVRGMAAIALGMIALIWHEMSLGVVGLLFGGYAMLDGLVGIAGAVRAAEMHQRWASLVIEGVAGVIAAIVTFAWPGMTILSLMYVIGAWALLTGVLEIAAARRLRKCASGEWLLVFSGIASLILGILMVSLPFAGLQTVVLWLGAYALLFGALLVGLGFRLRSWAKLPAPGSLAREVHAVDQVGGTQRK